MPGRKGRKPMDLSLRKIKKANAKKFGTTGTNNGRLSFWPIGCWKDDHDGKKEIAAKKAIGWLPPDAT